MDTFLIYHEVIMSLTTHLHQRRQLDIEAVAMDIATHLDALGVLVRQSYSPDAAVEKEDATTQYCTSDCHDNGQKTATTQYEYEDFRDNIPMCVVMPFGCEEHIELTRNSNSPVPGPSGIQNNNLTASTEPTRNSSSPVPGPSGLRTDNQSTVRQGEQHFSDSDSLPTPLSYDSSDMAGHWSDTDIYISDSD